MEESSENGMSKGRSIFSILVDTVAPCKRLFQYISGSTEMKNQTLRVSYKFFADGDKYRLIAHLRNAYTLNSI